MTEQGQKEQKEITKRSRWWELLLTALGGLCSGVAKGAFEWWLRWHNEL